MAFDGVARALRDQLTIDKFTVSGQSHMDGGPFRFIPFPRVTLAWTDAPGSTTATLIATI